MAREGLEVADVFRHFGQAFRDRHGASLSTARRRAMSAIELCRTAALGGHVERCGDCGHQRVAYNSCRNRNCPKCQGLARAQWLADRQAELLDVPYFHVVFTVPDEVAVIAFQNQTVVYDILFRAVSETLRTIAADPEHLGAEIGFLGVLHITVPGWWTIVAGKQQVRAVMRGVGAEVVARTRALIRSGSRKHPSAPGEPPRSVSGKLARSIRARGWKDGEGVTIRASEFYALFLSRGAKGGGGDTSKESNFVSAASIGPRRMKRNAISKKSILLPRPFLEPALNQAIANGLADRVRVAVMSGLKFQRGKA